jgi:hypothetical protein
MFLPAVRKPRWLTEPVDTTVSGQPCWFQLVRFGRIGWLGDDVRDEAPLPVSGTTLMLLSSSSDNRRAEMWPRGGQAFDMQRNL